jgi:hypothetical protein
MKYYSGDAVGRGTQSTGSNLGSTSWWLMKFQSGDGTTLTPDDKAKYTITFAATSRERANGFATGALERGNHQDRINSSSVRLRSRARCRYLHDRIANERRQLFAEPTISRLCLALSGIRSAAIFVIART